MPARGFKPRAGRADGSAPAADMKTPAPGGRFHDLSC